MNEPTHLDADGNARMVDVSAKDISTREASALAFVHLSPEGFQAIRRGNSKKGDVLGTARIAGVMGCKRTADLIPLCHPLALTDADLRFAWVDDEHAVAIRCTVRCEGKTGVEMEALCGASIAALTIYDMVKGIDRTAWIGTTHVAHKSGGRSGDWTHPCAGGPTTDDLVWL